MPAAGTSAAHQPLGKNGLWVVAFQAVFPRDAPGCLVPRGGQEASRAGKAPASPGTARGRLPGGPGLGLGLWPFP